MTHFLQTPGAKLISTYYSVGLLMHRGPKLFRALQAWRSSSFSGLRVWAADWPLPPGRPPGLSLPRSTTLRARGASPSSLLARPGPTGPSSPGGPRRRVQDEKAAARGAAGWPRPAEKPRGPDARGALTGGRIPRGPPRPAGGSRARGGAKRRPRAATRGEAAGGEGPGPRPRRGVVAGRAPARWAGILRGRGGAGARPAGEGPGRGGGSAEAGEEEEASPGGAGRTAPESH